MLAWLLSHAGWVFINIMIPLAVPFIGIGLISVAPKTPSTDFVSQVKDGQLGWIAIAMCAAGLYEISEARRACEIAYVLPSDYFDALEGSLICSACLAFLLSSAGAVFVTSKGNTLKRLSWMMHYKVFCSTFIITTVSAISFVLVHYASTPGCSNIGIGASHG